MLPAYRQSGHLERSLCDPGATRRAGIGVALTPAAYRRQPGIRSQILKLGAIAVDYDGTIATNGTMPAEMRAAIGAARTPALR